MRRQLLFFSFFLAACVAARTSHADGEAVLIGYVEINLDGFAGRTDTILDPVVEINIESPSGRTTTRQVQADGAGYFHLTGVSGEAKFSINHFEALGGEIPATMRPVSQVGMQSFSFHEIRRDPVASSGELPPVIDMGRWRVFVDEDGGISISVETWAFKVERLHGSRDVRFQGRANPHFEASPFNHEYYVARLPQPWSQIVRTDLEELRELASQGNLGIVDSFTFGLDPRHNR